jgi:hypothetical protein
MRQNRAQASSEGLDEAAHAAAVCLWVDETGAILADEAAARFMVGEAS